MAFTLPNLFGKRPTCGCIRKRLCVRAAKDLEETPSRQEAAKTRVALGYQRYCMGVMYDGTAYKGWQLQKNTRKTIQGELEKVLHIRFQQPIRVVGASRTDAGVHARGQCAHFDLPPGEYDLERALFSMNRLLPDDIRIKSIDSAPKLESAEGHSWSAMHSATGKHYSYKFCLGRFMDPTHRLYRALEFRPIDVQVLNETLQKTVGTHDFSGFASGPLLDEKIRTIFSAVLKEDPGQSGYFEIDFHLSGALYKMLRNIVGTSMRVAAGAAPVDTIDKILQTGGRHKDKRCADARGLCLEQVFYATDANVPNGWGLEQ